MIHDLKCWPSFFVGLESGAKPFEVRKDDRDFAVGDRLLIREYLAGRDAYTGRELHFNVGTILRDFPGIEPGYCVLGLQRLHVA